MNRLFNVKKASFILLLCLFGLSSLARAQSIFPDTLGLVNKPFKYYFTYGEERFAKLSYMYVSFKKLDDPLLLNSYYKYQKTFKATRITSAVGGFLIGFAGAALLLNGNRINFNTPALYSLLGTGIITTGISIGLERRSHKHARNAIGQYNSLVRWRVF